METLQKLDEEASNLQKEGNYLEALQKVEEALIIRRNEFGPESDQVMKSSKQLCELCNLLAMVYLQKENFDLALDLLKKSEIISEGNDQGKAVTYNNLACFYRRVGKIRSALTYLQKALSIEQRLQECESPADTHLNMCAVLSQLDKHEEALEHSMQALILLQEEIINKVQAFVQNPDQQQFVKKFEDRAAVLAIAYHNMGVELEFLKRYVDALTAYKKAYLFSMKHLGAEHAITNNLQGVYETARKQMSEMQQKAEKRKATKTKQSSVQSKSSQNTSKNKSKYQYSENPSLQNEDYESIQSMSQDKSNQQDLKEKKQVQQNQNTQGIKVNKEQFQAAEKIPKEEQKSQKNEVIEANKQSNEVQLIQETQQQKPNQEIKEPQNNQSAQEAKPNKEENKAAEQPKPAQVQGEENKEAEKKT